MKGSCIVKSQCKGTVKSGYCPGVQYCCIAPGASGPAYTSQGVDVSVGQSLAVMKCFLDPKDPKHKVTSTAGNGAIGPALTGAQASTIASSVYDHFGVRFPLYDGSSPIPTLNNAILAGFKAENINVYFISFKASEGAGATFKRLQAAATILRAGKFGTLWLDVETGPNYWTANTATNCAYLTQLVKSIQADKTNFPWNLGIYSGLSTWGSLLGKCDMAAFQNLPFWYAAYTGHMDFSYMASHPMPKGFGWTSAAVTQWRGTTGFCGAQVDFNIYK